MNTFNVFLTLWQILNIAIIALIVYCLYDILKNKFEKNNKLIWVLVVLFIPLFGALFYLSIGRKQRITA